MDTQFDVIIIGAGPAGLTAALYASRAGLSCAILESAMPGGKLTKTYSIENYPGTKAINGTDLAMSMFDHATQFGAQYLYGDVIDVIVENEIKTVVTTDNSYTAKAVIVASGTKEKMLDLPREQELIGKGISFCAVCDGALFRGKDVVIIGGGNSALEEALFLTEFVNKIYIVIRRDVFRADKIIVDKVYANDKIEVITKHIPYEIVGEDKVEGIILQNVDDKSLKTINASAIFPYIGALPNTSFLSKLDVLTPNGYMMVNSAMETKIKGLFGAGDCIDKTLRQVITACGDGALAGQNCYKYINDMEY